MEYIILTILGIISVLVIKSNWTVKKQITVISLVIIIGLLLFIFIDILFIQKYDFIEKGTSSFDTISWFDIVLYFIMLLGMASKYIFDAIGKGNKIKFKKWQLFKPILVSPIVFGTIYANLGDYTSTLLLIVFSFQNGFFWQTVLNKK